MPPVVAVVSAVGSAIGSIGAGIAGIIGIGGPISLLPGIGWGVAGGAGAVIGSTALSIALSAAQALLLRPGGGTSTPLNDPGFQSTVRQSIPAQRLILGRATVSGAIFWINDTPPYLRLGYLIAAHQCAELEELYLNGNRVFIGSDGFATSVPFADGATKYIKVSTRLGASDQAIDPIIAAANPSMPASFRQRGHTTIVIQAAYNDPAITDPAERRDNHDAIYGTSGFNPLFRVKGATVFDPRDPSQDVDDPTTWKWSDTATLCLMRYLIHQWPTGRLIEPGRIDWDRVAAEATRDEELVPLKGGGWEKRYTVNSVVSADTVAIDAVRQLLTANAGKLIIDGRRIYPVSGVPREPVRTINQGMLAGGFEIRMDQSRRNVLNTVRTQFVAPDRDYTLAVGPVLENASYKSADGQAYEAGLPLPATEGAARAQRLGKIALEQSRRGRFIRATLSYGALEITAGDVVRVEWPDFAHCTGIYQVERADLTPDMSAVSMELSEYSTDTFAWNAASDEQDFTLDDDVLEAAA